MMETILSWISGAVGQLLQWFVDTFMDKLDMSLSAIITQFPVLPVAYKILQAAGLGLLLAMATFSALKFMGGSLANVQDTPVQLLIRTGASAALIFFGNYILTMVVDIAKIPYDVFRNMDSIDGLGGFVIPDASDLVAGAIGGPAILLLSIILILVIFWNVLQLMIEVVERYFMVGLLVYTSPIIFPFLSSAGTSQVFSKWCGMFAGQCALMSISSMFLNIIISGFQYTGGDTDYLLRFVMTLAVCKIAQRVDSYIQQLGIGVATTGGNLMGDIIGVVGMMGMGRGGRFAGKDGGGTSERSGGSRTSVLGSKVSGMGGVVGMAANAVSSGFAAYKEGGNASEVIDQAAEGAKQGLKNTVVPRGVRNAFAERKENLTKKSLQAQSDFGEKAAKWTDKGGGPSFSKNFQETAKAAGMTAQQYARTQFNMNGAGAPVSDVKMTVDKKTGKKTPETDDSGKQVPSGSFTLNKHAVAAGLSLGTVQDPVGIDTQVLLGPDQSVAAHMQDNFNSRVTTPDGEKRDYDATESYHETLVNTAKYGSPLVAEQVLFDDRADIADNDALGEACIQNTFGAEIEPGVGDFADIKPGQHLENVQARTQERITDAEGRVHGGGRVVTAEYSKGKDKDGHEIGRRNVEIMDKTAYDQLPKQEQVKMRQITARGSGESYFLRTSDVTVEDTSQPRRASRGTKANPVGSSRKTRESKTPPEKKQSGVTKLRRNIKKTRGQ